MNEKYRCLAPEEMYVDTVYSFSFSPSDQPEGQGTGHFKLNALKTYHDALYKVFDSCKNSDYEVVHELSRNGRWHFHGYIMLRNVIKFFVHDMPKLRLNGTYEIDYIDSTTDKWEKYVYKQRKYTEAYCQEYNTPYVLRICHESRQRDGTLRKQDL